ncbi:hypothetical protein AQS8620_00890 [Aquimixticola soesokkakensis]|uniref:Uncharacterized protein n=1 Tax=Aquimixticola soesokkakensis TaxID=1519096 RepID=A0A1Y5RZD4_9RHOB|nr:hypothetical protein AQS8620_00890 [Aquimixticola soesokkakensis]
MIADFSMLFLSARARRPESGNRAVAHSGSSLNGCCDRANSIEPTPAAQGDALLVCGISQIGANVTSLSHIAFQSVRL